MLLSDPRPYPQGIQMGTSQVGGFHMYLKCILPAVLALSAIAGFEELKGIVGTAGELIQLAGYVLPAMLVSRVARLLVIGK